MVSTLFRRLFHGHAAYVLGRLRLLGIPEDERQDLAQDIFLKVSRALDRLDPARPVRPWLLAITCNRARDWFRQRHREQRALAAYTEPEESPVDRFDAACTLRRLFASLSFDHREVLLLVEVEGYTVPEAAKLLGLKVKTAESRVARARAELAAVAARHELVERRRLGEAAPAIMFDLQGLLRAGRADDEDLGGEVEELWRRVERALTKPPPSRSTTGTPAGTWIGLGVVVVVAVVGAVDAISAAPVVALPESAPVLPALTTASAEPTVLPAATTAPTVLPAAMTAPSAVHRARPKRDEGELLALARRAMQEKDMRRALAFLREHERDYPQGQFRPERVALLTRLASRP